jgi:hypothetical protein
MLPSGEPGAAATETTEIDLRGAGHWVRDGCRHAVPNRESAGPAFAGMTKVGAVDGESERARSVLCTATISSFEVSIFGAG